MTAALKLITQTESWKQEVQTDVVTRLRELLAMAESGEIQGIAYACATVDQLCGHWVYEEQCPERHHWRTRTRQAPHDSWRTVSNSVQVQHPVTKRWLKVSTITGRIIGERRRPYAVPVYQMRANPLISQGDIRQPARR